MYLRKKLSHPLQCARLCLDALPKETDEFSEAMRQRDLARAQYLQENDGQISLEILLSAYSYEGEEQWE